MTTDLKDKLTFIKENPLNILLQIRNFILISCKIISIILFSYYIIKVHEYEITWTLFATYLPAFVANINEILTFFGTMILIIPLSLIITSFFHENRILHLFATWLSFGGSMFAVFFGIFNRTLLDNINLKFFRITHLLSLNDKRDIFQQKYLTIADVLGNNVEEKTQFILKHFSSANQKIYDNELVSFKTVSDIDDYAFSLCIRFGAQFDDMQNQLKSANKTAWSIFDHVTPGTLIFGVVTITIILGCLYFIGSSSAETTRQVALQTQALHELTSKQNTLNIEMMKTLQTVKEQVGTAFNNAAPSMQDQAKAVQIFMEETSIFKQTTKALLQDMVNEQRAGMRAVAALGGLDEQGRANILKTIKNYVIT